LPNPIKGGRPGDSVRDDHQVGRRLEQGMKRVGGPWTRMGIKGPGNAEFPYKIPQAEAARSVGAQESDTDELEQVRAF
jgi:hypothetical protein